MMVRSLTRTGTFLLLLGAARVGTAEVANPRYETDVRPVLKTHCFHCHGEAGEREGGLDLRLRRLIVAGGESGPAIVPGNSDESLLLQRVAAGDMPPGDDKQLSPSEIETLRRWIADGAPTVRAEPESLGEGPLFTEEERNYWAFRPIIRPAVPRVQHTEQVRTPIDAFVLARLQQAIVEQGSDIPVRFSSDASRRQLARRAWLDLLGLLPPPEDVDRFDADPSPVAWEMLVERLLSSPHYGERWGRHWLDVAGYADSEGYTDADRVREHAFRYRDYVIRSFNSDKPFDQFIIEQLAGDELVTGPLTNLEPAAVEKLVATGFLRMAPDGTDSGGIEQPVARNQVIADTLQIVGSSLLGLTVHCAQCHDHRYDPIPQADYYRMRAIFEPAFDWNNWRTPQARRISLYTDADRQQAAAIEEEAAQIDRERLAKAEEYITRTLEEELLLVPEAVRDKLRVAYRTNVKERSEEQAALLKDHPSVANISVGSLYLYDRRREERARKIDAARAEKEKRFIETTRQSELAKLEGEERTRVEQALQVTEASRSAEQVALLQSHPGVLVTLETLAQFNPEAAAELEQDRTQAAALRGSKAADDLKAYSERAAEVRARKPVEGFIRALTETPGKVPPTQVFHRGDHEQPKDVVEPAELSILERTNTIPVNDDQLSTSGRRLALARSLTDGTHPLVARVLVNRIWMQHFGRGLVNSPGDFGVLGDSPTHPELLDWLAAEFMDSGWSVKHMHRLILHSTVYRQSSLTSQAVTMLDPDNTLYARFPMRRIESEVLRDVLLTAGGSLNPKLYGPPVPVMEDEVGQIILGIENLDGERKPTDRIPLNGEEYRRSIYVQVRRTRTLSVFEAFDAPAMTPNCERRNQSTVALQSLMLMNSDFAAESAGRIADRLMREAGDELDDRLRTGWRLLFAEVPDEEELMEARDFIAAYTAAIQQAPNPPDAEALSRQALAAWCQALLASNRFLHIE